jgi:hypothetical protein
VIVKLKGLDDLNSQAFALHCGSALPVMMEHEILLALVRGARLLRRASKVMDFL